MTLCRPLVVLLGGRRVEDTSVGLLPLPELEDEGALATLAASLTEFMKLSKRLGSSPGLALALRRVCLFGRGVSDLAALTIGKLAPAPMFRPGVPGFGRLVAFGDEALLFAFAALAARVALTAACAALAASALVPPWLRKALTPANLALPTGGASPEDAEDCDLFVCRTVPAAGRSTCKSSPPGDRLRDIEPMLLSSLLGSGDSALGSCSRFNLGTGAGGTTAGGLALWTG